MTEDHFDTIDNRIESETATLPPELTSIVKHLFPKWSINRATLTPTCVINSYLYNSNLHIFDAQILILIDELWDIRLKTQNDGEEIENT